MTVTVTVTCDICGYDTNESDLVCGDCYRDMERKAEELEDRVMELENDKDDLESTVKELERILNIVIAEGMNDEDIS